MAFELVNHIDERTMGVLVPKEDMGDGEEEHNYEPYIMWNLEVISCISAPIEISEYGALIVVFLCD